LVTKILTTGLLVVLFLFVLLGPIPIPESMGVGDFRAYWSAAYLLSQSENFADAEQLMAVEQAHTSWEGDFPVITWNPPWLLAILLPYTAVSFTRATWLWLITNILIVFTGTILTWKTLASQEKSQRLGHLAPLAGLLFLPTMLTLWMGQVNSLVFLGLAAFLYFANRNQLFAAGAFLVLTLVKPHLVYLSLPIIFLHLFWKRRDFRLLAGLVTSTAVLTVVVLALRPSFLTDYATTVAEGSLLGWETPTLGGVLGSYLGWEWAKLMGIVILPLVIWLWWRYKEQLPLNIWVQATLLLSVVTAPFGWAYDVIVLLLPLLQIIIWLAEERYNRLEALTLVILLVGINVGAIYQRTLGINELEAYWVPIALSLLFFAAYFRAT
jgi:hypothetical protein